MTLYGIKPAYTAAFSLLCLTVGAVQLFRHGGPYWLMIVLFVAVAWSNGQSREAGQRNPAQLSSSAFFVMLLAPFLGAAALVWGIVMEL
ncbi:hypothetical protein [Streptomyces neyagawaensis]|uniref:hypothetical protein n=1 Tax=Streptomyces neyagawaensis TaxID=42238 RepID=UPI0006E252F7|nr:hypothetical protein [Streptomyces neyagawaensis]MCL6737396.1 hypothetical protein [Streptomyces neyagawaensis]